MGDEYSGLKNQRSGEEARQALASRMASSKTGFSQGGEVGPAEQSARDQMSTAAGGSKRKTFRKRNPDETGDAYMRDAYAAGMDPAD